MHRSSMLATARRLSLTLLASAIASLGLSAHAAADDGAYARGRILIEAKAGLSDDSLAKLLQAHGARGRKLGKSRLHLVDLPAGASEVEMVARLAKRPELKFAELDRVVSTAMAVNDPYIGSAWHLSKIGAPTAWDSTMGAGVTIAVLDTGINAAQPDLQARMVAGYNVVNSNTDVGDLCGHGTAVAGAAAASANNGTGVAGVAGAARIMPLRVVYTDSTGCHAYLSSIASAVTYAADHGARVANASFVGLSSSAAVQSAAAYLKSKNGLLFVAAGNTGALETLSSDGSMIPVSATDSSDAKASFSSYGSYVALAAPGAGIWTTNADGSYGSWSGTSFASPVAAGVAALMMAARPDLAASQIQSLLFSSAVDLGSAGRDNVFGYGRVDAAAAVRAARADGASLDSSAPLAAIAAPLASSSVSGLVAVSVNASDNVGVARVDLKVNGTVVASDNAAPYSFSWNSASVPNGMANLVAVAYDAAGNAGSSATVALNVANGSTGSAIVAAGDTTAPRVAINPLGASVTGNVSVNVSASDNSGTAGLNTSVSIDGVLVAQGSGGSLSYRWNTRKLTPGLHTIGASARDAAGNVGSASLQVTSAP